MLGDSEGEDYLSDLADTLNRLADAGYPVTITGDRVTCRAGAVVRSGGRWAARPLMPSFPAASLAPMGDWAHW